MAKWFFAKGQSGKILEEGDVVNATTTKAGLVKKSSKVLLINLNVSKTMLRKLHKALNVVCQLKSSTTSRLATLLNAIKLRRLENNGL